MRFLSIPLLLSALALIAACGFQPVHGPALSSGNSSVQIAEIDGRSGHALRKALLQETASGLPGTDYADISVEIRENLSRIGFDSDGLTTRSAITLQARYVVDLGDDALSGNEVAVVNYAVPDSPYGDISAQNDAAERAANVLAKRIVDDITFQLSKR